MQNNVGLRIVLPSKKPTENFFFVFREKGASENWGGGGGRRSFRYEGLGKDGWWMGKVLFFPTVFSGYTQMSRNFRGGGDDPPFPVFIIGERKWGGKTFSQ